MIDETPRTETEIRESIAYHKRVIRHLEIIFIVMVAIAVALFAMIAWKNGIVNVLSLAAAMIAAFKLWQTGADWEVSKFWDEVELNTLITKETHEEENEKNV
jgi:phage-related minor tail protein